MAGSIFNSESFVWKPFGWVADILLMSGLWFVCSVPIVTLGAATTALYDCAVRCVRGRDQKIFARFFRTFKRELGQSVLCELFWAGVIAVGYWLIKTFGNHVAVTDAAVVATVAMLLILVVAVGVACWVLPLLSRFTFSFGPLNATAVKLALANIPRTMALGLSTVVAAWVCIQWWIPFLFVPMLLMLLWSLLLEPVFRKYMPEETDER